jgi:reverse gyrase
VAAVNDRKCPNCGSDDATERENGFQCNKCLGVHRTVYLNDSAEAHDGIRTQGRDDQGEKMFDNTHGADLFRLTGEWDELTRIKDYKNDRYYEEIRKADGTLKRPIVDEPLSQHVPTAVRRRQEQQPEK